MSTFLKALRRPLCTVTCGVVVACGLGGCSVVTQTEPLTGRRQFIVVPENTEIGMGEEAWAGIQQQERLSSNQALTAAVERVGRAISAIAGKPDYQWEFKLFASATPNAFCLPGGKVAVYEGLFTYLANDAELAAVVGHEVGHAIARHGAERMSHQLLANVGAAALSYGLKDKAAQDQQRWLAAYTGATTIGFILPYSRTHEYAADKIGLMLMARAGYDPSGALTFWEKFAELGKGHSTPEFLSTHPVGENRIARLKENLQAAQVEYRRAPKRIGTGATYR